MTAIDHEAEYNNRTRIPEYRDIIARWAAASARERVDPATGTPATGAELDQPYGSGERQRYDLFATGDRSAPLIVHIHGGYWQLGDRQGNAFIARAFTAAGIAVAVPSYSLCPQVSVLQIIDELRRCLAALWQRTARRPLVVGHSAGGHLAAALLATDWRGVAGAPPGLVRAAVAISGVFDLSPLIATTMNAALRLDPASAAAASPLYWPPPPPGTRFVSAVGDAETGEFHRQSRALTDAWATAGVATERIVIPGVNHFTIIDELTRPDSVLFRRVAALATMA